MAPVPVLISDLRGGDRAVTFCIQPRVLGGLLQDMGEGQGQAPLDRKWLTPDPNVPQVLWSGSALGTTGSAGHVALGREEPLWAAGAPSA